MSPKSHKKRPFQPLSAASPREGAVPVLRPDIVIGKSTETLSLAQLAVLVVAPELGRLKNSPEQPLPDWAEAVRVAAARLREKFGIDGDDSDPALTAMAQELAVFLCAYGKLAEEVDRLAARTKAAEKANDPTLPDPRRFDNAPSCGERRSKHRLGGRIKISPVVAASKGYARPRAE